MSINITAKYCFRWDNYGQKPLTCIECAFEEVVETENEEANSPITYKQSIELPPKKVSFSTVDGNSRIASCIAKIKFEAKTTQTNPTLNAFQQILTTNPENLLEGRKVTSVKLTGEFGLSQVSISPGLCIGQNQQNHYIEFDKLSEDQKLTGIIEKFSVRPFNENKFTSVDVGIRETLNVFYQTKIGVGLNELQKLKEKITTAQHEINLLKEQRTTIENTASTFEVDLEAKETLSKTVKIFDGFVQDKEAEENTYNIQLQDYMKQLKTGNMQLLNHLKA